MNFIEFIRALGLKQDNLLNFSSLFFASLSVLSFVLSIVFYVQESGYFIDIGVNPNHLENINYINRVYNVGGFVVFFMLILLFSILYFSFAFHSIFSVSERREIDDCFDIENNIKFKIKIIFLCLLIIKCLIEVFFLKNWYQILGLNTLWFLLVFLLILKNNFISFLKRLIRKKIALIPLFFLLLVNSSFSVMGYKIQNVQNSKLHFMVSFNLILLFLFMLSFSFETSLLLFTKNIKKILESIYINMFISSSFILATILGTISIKNEKFISFAHRKAGLSGYKIDLKLKKEFCELYQKELNLEDSKCVNDFWLRKCDVLYTGNKGNYFVIKTSKTDEIKRGILVKSKYIVHFKPLSEK